MLAVLVFAAAAASADVSGLWRTPTDNGVVEVRHCGADICGRLLTSDKIKADPALTDRHDRNEALRARPLKGLELFKGFSGSGSGSGAKWTGGQIYNPDDGGTYHASVELQDATHLKVTGCIVAPFCKSETWVRLPATGSE
jgi:uncharacterized protein (DUF2147 family)